MIQAGTLVHQGQRTLVRWARRRRFGSLFYPLRRSYIVTLPTLMLAAALICWSTGTDFSMIIGAVVLSGVSMVLLFDLLARRRPLRVSTILAITLALAYGLGTANTWFTLPRGDETLGEFLRISTSELAYAMASVLVAVAALLAFGELYETPIFGEEFELEFNNRSIVFLTLGTLALAFSYATGSTNFMGAVVSTTDIGHIGFLASLADWLAGPLLALAVVIGLNARGRFTRNYARVLTVLLFLMIFPLGRRIMLYSIILALVGLRLGRYRIPFSPLKKTVLLGLLATFLYFATIGFFYLRVAGYQLVHPTLTQRIGAALRIARERSYSDIKSEFSANVETRTFILGFLAQVEGYAVTMPTAHGRDLAEQFQLALPSLLYPDKDLFFTEEQLTNELFGSEYIDEANSIFTAGAVDFGFWGVIVYPFLVVLIFRAFFEVISESLPVFASCFIILGSFATILEPENTVTAYFVIMRNGLLFGGFVWFIMSLPEFRVKNVGL